MKSRQRGLEFIFMKISNIIAVIFLKLLSDTISNFLNDKWIDPINTSTSTKSPISFNCSSVGFTPVGL